jgi:oxygen-independent coproporphyrinogen III oxidase
MPLPILQSPPPTFTIDSLPHDKIPGLYVHIPFCFHKCGYCDFYSITRQSAQRMDRFVDLLLQEAATWSAWSTPDQIRPRTAFFGGGTPSLLPLASMQRLIRGLRTRFDFSHCTEWTVEVNPATITLDYCQMLHDSGITRLSMGAQSFHPEDLRILERHHNPDDVAQSLTFARQAGFQRLNIDLIYAIPGQSLDAWITNLESAIALNTDHLSCYNLTYEPNTPITVRKRLGQIHPTGESTELAILHHTRQRLTQANLPPYEISNYSKPNFECQHNLLYWTGQNYIGLGPSAASHLSGHRWKNRPHLGQWESAIQSNTLPATDIEHLPPRQRAAELAMLQLRLTRGINLQDFQRQTQQNPLTLFAPALTRLLPTHLIELTNTTLRVTDSGIKVTDAIAAEFLNCI